MDYVLVAYPTPQILYELMDRARGHPPTPPTRGAHRPQTYHSQQYNTSHPLRLGSGWLVLPSRFPRQPNQPTRQVSSGSPRAAHHPPASPNLSSPRAGLDRGGPRCPASRPIRRRRRRRHEPAGTRRTCQSWTPPRARPSSSTTAQGNPDPSRPLAAAGLGATGASTALSPSVPLESARLPPEMGARGLVCRGTFSLCSLEVLIGLGLLHM
jgi:hypothetical protein